MTTAMREGKRKKREKDEKMKQRGRKKINEEIINMKNENRKRS